MESGNWNAGFSGHAAGSSWSSAGADNSRFKNNCLENEEQEKVFYKLKERLRKTEAKLRMGKLKLPDRCHPLQKESSNTRISCIPKFETVRDGSMDRVRCTIQLAGNVVVASADGSNETLAQLSAFGNAMTKFRTTYLRIVNDSEQPEKRFLEVSVEPFEGQDPSAYRQSATKVFVNNKKIPPSKRKLVPGGKPIEECYLYLREGLDTTDLSCLTYSSNINKWAVSYEFTKEPFGDGESRTRCILAIDGEPYADVQQFNRDKAKRVASTRAIAQIKQKCWTIVTKKRSVDPNECGLSRHEVERTCQGQFLKGIEDYIDTLTADSPDELVFGTDFRPSDRPFIEEQCRKRGMQIKTSNMYKKLPYITATYAVNPGKLFSLLQKQGGETPQYRLEPPQKVE